MFTKFNRLIYRFERRYIVRTTLCDKSFVLPFINFLSRNINICKYILNIYSQYVLHKCDCSMQRIIQQSKNLQLFEDPYNKISFNDIEPEISSIRPQMELVDYGISKYLYSIETMRFKKLVADNIPADGDRFFTRQIVLAN